jgi:N-acyl homoserine lactone hydrolase
MPSRTKDDANRHTVRPSKLYLLQLATTTIQTPGGALEMSSGCYLIQMTNGVNVLVDTGHPDDLPLPAGAVREHEVAPRELLGRIGVNAADVDLVVCTHFDIDHVGHHEEFKGAEFVVQRRHYELAQAGNERFSSGKRHWGDGGLRYRLIDGDVELMPGLRLIETSGHTTGHQSVLVTLPETGPVLLAIDAVMLARLFVADRPASPADENGDELRASTRKLLDLVEAEGVRLVVFGHDGQQWRDLKLAPNCYS